MPNRLAAAASPYLQLHASNPVDWYPWGEAAFARARELDRPIFLSIGYYTCHWCHVMERESFSEAACAELLNDNFVSIKVDREERPDIDRLYMSFVQATTGGGGWPMSVFLTPDRKPFHGGTYYPPRDRHGLPSFSRLLRTIAAAWRDDRPRLLAAANDVSAYLEQALTPAAAAAGASTSAAVMLQDSWPKLFAELKASYDPASGGFGGAPKFPRPVAHAFLLRYAKLHQGEPEAGEAIAMVTSSLRAMVRGGVHDQLAGGFHRYAVDAAWRVPHFEKMLYDQAQLASSFVEAWQVTHASDLAEAASSTCDFVLHEMTSSEGGFYSAQDADSPVPENHRELSGSHEGEGAYYLWTQEEINGLLQPEPAALFCRAYGVKTDGNVAMPLDPQGEFRGRNILYLADEAASQDPKLTEARALLYARRRERPAPPIDTKILTAWNGLMISALAQTAAALDEPSFRAAAMRAATFIEASRWDRSAQLLRRTAEVDGFAEDYAYLIQGLLDLHQASLEPHWLEWAHLLQQAQEERFAAPGGGYYSSQPDPELLLRVREDYDGAEPSPNSVAVSNLLRLGLWYENEGWREKAEAVITAFADKLRTMPQALPLLCAQLEAVAAPPRRLMIAGDPAASDTHALLAIARRRFLPGYWIMPAAAPASGRAAAYLCEDYTCQLPVTTPEALEQALI
ncbi:MAG: thioredoxin domain-containing protein [Acidobacteria bacterium]|nr:MAG: thioredoxin domain-containing protein [Acidobacteriota bacterium]